MAVVTGDRYLELLVRYLEHNADALLDGSLTLKLNPVGLHYVHTRLEAMRELEGLLTGAPVDYLRAYVSDLGDHRALEQLRRILRLLTSLKVISTLPSPTRDPTPLSLVPFSRLRVLELRGCDLSTSEARGLLELRHSLERLICHNSTEALRHIFASRIVDIKDSPVWKRLSFVSCACNGLLLMDESLQLLPIVESLDLSRNKFAKVDNLRKCTKLQYLDLGFNHLRTVASLSEVISPIVKLVLRNNALTTLRGIENLKLVEGLDVSYNIISSFSELEVLSTLPSLKNLWLEGNPVCCARWYRAHIFSIFPKPEKIKLDDEGISTREYWERHAIVAKRQKTPAVYGFYFPAKDDADIGVNSNRSKRRFSRLVSIDEEQKLLGPEVDHESNSCDSEYKDENAISDGEEDIINFINMVEAMKKERSVLWLREFKEWLDKEPENAYVENKSDPLNLYNKKGHYGRKKIHQHLGESSMSAVASIEDSEPQSCTNIMPSDISQPNAFLHSHKHNCLDSHANKADSSVGYTHGGQHKRLNIRNVRKHMIQTGSGEWNAIHSSLSTVSPVRKENAELTFQLPPSAFGEIMGSRSSSSNTGSPPQYKDDILQRRHTLDEELLQVSGDSYLLTSSDSETSCSDDDSCGLSACFSELFLNKELANASSNNLTTMKENANDDDNMPIETNGKPLHSATSSNSCDVHNSDDETPSTVDGSDYNKIAGQNYIAEDKRTVVGAISPDKRQSNRKPKKRVVSLTDKCSLLSKPKGQLSDETNDNDGHEAPNHTNEICKALPDTDRNLVGLYEGSAY